MHHAQGGATTPLAHLPARAEVQALAGATSEGGESLAAIDAYGHVTLARDAAGAGAHGSPGAVACLAPPHASFEPSWAGVAFAQGAPHVLATARHLARAVRGLSGASAASYGCTSVIAARSQVDLYDGDLHVQCLHTPSYPCAVTFLCVVELLLHAMGRTSDSAHVTA